MGSHGHHDPGWNDPPIFTYEKSNAIQTAAAGKKGMSLNKRVAFPINGKIENVQGNSNYDPGKPPMMYPPSVPCSVSPIKSDEPPQNSDDKSTGTQQLEKVLKNLQIDTISDDEIVKRLKVMEKMWIDDNLDLTVRSKILELSKALANDDPDLADHIQKSLMVDKISQCSSWMSGIRHLINQKRSEKR